MGLPLDQLWECGQVTSFFSLSFLIQKMGTVVEAPTMVVRSKSDLAQAWHLEWLAIEQKKGPPSFQAGTLRLCDL